MSRDWRPSRPASRVSWCVWITFGGKPLGHHVPLRLSTNGSKAKRRNNFLGRSVVSVLDRKIAPYREFSRNRARSIGGMPASNSPAFWSARGKTARQGCGGGLGVGRGEHCRMGAGGLNNG
jgi:hypothetical protein